MSELHDYLAEGYDPGETRERFKVTDESGAEWALLKLGKLQRALDQKKAMAAAELTRITEWLEHESAQLNGDINFFTGLLEEFHRNVLEEDPKATSISLPAGKLKSRAGSRSVVVSDLETFVEWAKKELPVLLRVSYEPDKALLKSFPTADDGTVVTENGEPIPGVVVVEGERSFKVEVSS